MHFVIAYDIEQNRRRNKVMNTLKDLGLRVQYSVFEGELTYRRAGELLERLRSIIDPRRDRVHMYPLCDTCYFRSQAIGDPMK